MTFTIDNRKGSQRKQTGEGLCSWIGACHSIYCGGLSLSHTHTLVCLSQKRVVDLVKKRIGAVSLAIGDGANDVGMIKGER